MLGRMECSILCKTFFYKVDSLLTLFSWVALGSYDCRDLAILGLTLVTQIAMLLGAYTADIRLHHCTYRCPKPSCFQLHCYPINCLLLKSLDSICSFTVSLPPGRKWGAAVRSETITSSASFKFSFLWDIYLVFFWILLESCCCPLHRWRSLI